MQMGSGAFPWFSGGRENYFITRHIVAGFGHLEKLGVDIESAEALLQSAIRYLDKEIVEEAEKWEEEESQALQNTSSLHYLYARSFFMDAFPPNEEVKKILQKIGAV